MIYVALIFLVLIIDLQYIASCLGLEFCLVLKSFAMAVYMEFMSLSVEIRKEEIK